MKTGTGVRLAAGVGAAMLAFAPFTARAGEVAGGVVGCNAPGSKQEGGALIGALIGGIAGSNLAKNDRGTGTVVGAAAGAAAGSYVGCKMQKSDAQKAAAPPPRAHSRIYPVAPREEVEAEYVDRPAYVERPVYVERPAYVEERRFVPPGLAKKGYGGLPPGQARKYYAVGERLPVSYVRESRYYVEQPARYRLRRPPPGCRWVIVEHDAYLVRTETGVITEVVKAILG